MSQEKASIPKTTNAFLMPMSWSLRFRLTFYLLGQYLWFSVGIVLGKIHAKLKASKAFTLFIFFFQYLSLLTNMGCPEKSGQPALWSVNKNDTVCNKNHTRKEKAQKADSETRETIPLCIDMQRWIPTGGKIMMIGSSAILQAGLRKPHLVR
jgi:hypothetical protein